jgi:hypothetical protein
MPVPALGKSGGMCVSLTDLLRNRSNMEQIAIRNFPGQVPSFVGAELERLYENVFSSLPFVDAYADPAAPASTYVAEKDGKPVAVLLYRRQGNMVRVLNEVITLAAEEIRRFAEFIFAHEADVQLISFNAIRSELQELSLPFRKFTCSEDIVVPLPKCVDAYFSSLGNATRKNIKRYRNKLGRDFPGFQHRVLSGTEIGEQHVRAIIDLNTARMLRKQKVPGYDEGERRKLLQLVRACGFVSLLEINGRLAGGEICTRVGRHYFSHVGGHDAEYEDYGIGTFGCYLAICEAIRCCGSEFHLLWGQYPYKYSLGGEQRDLERLLIFRSHVQLCLNGGVALAGAIDERMRKMKLAARGKIGNDRAGQLLQFAVNVASQWRSGVRGQSRRH